MKDKRIWILSGIVLVVAACVCAAGFGVKAYTQKQAEAEYRALAAQNSASADKTDSPAEEDLSPSQPSEAQEEQTDGESQADDEEETVDILEQLGVPIPEMDIDFAEFQEKTNEDIYAWIYIPGTAIDYPILQHPTDNSYYLEHNLNGSTGYPGCIYTENYNTRDFSDPNTVVYGHNMKNGTMFAGLHKFEDSRFFEEHPYVYVYTEDGLLVYEIFAAHISGDEHILLTYDFENELVFQYYLEDIYENRGMNSNVREDVEVSAENHILTLSTCISGKPNNRYLVQGVLLNED